MTDSQVHIETFRLGPLETNAYLLRCGDACWVVDPGMFPRLLLNRLKEAQLSPDRILLTHGHGDHIAGATEIKQACPDALLCCPTADAEMLTDPTANLSMLFGVEVLAPPADELFDPGQMLELGSSSWQVLDTRGHTPGGVSFYCEQAGVVITGDALFAGGIGRTDIPNGSASRLLANIRANLLTLPGEVSVLPGHGPASTIEQEKRSNPFFSKDY